MRENRAFTGIVIAADGIGMRLCTAQQMIGLPKILRQQFQRQNHMVHIDTRRADGLPVKLLGKLCVERRLLRAGAADAAEGLFLLILKKARVYRTDKRVPVKNRDDIFAKTCVAHSEICVSSALTFVIYSPDHTQAHPVMRLVGLHIHAERIRVRQERTKRLVQMLIDCNKTAKILDAQLHAVPLRQVAQISIDLLKGVVHAHLRSLNPDCSLAYNITTVKVQCSFVQKICR